MSNTPSTACALLCHSTTAPTLVPLPYLIEHLVFFVTTIYDVPDVGDGQRSFSDVRGKNEFSLGGGTEDKVLFCKRQRRMKLQNLVAAWLPTSFLDLLIVLVLFHITFVGWF